MELLLKGLLDDLSRRCELIARRLSNAADETPEVRDCALRAYREVEKARRHCVELAADPALSSPQVAPDFLRGYRRLSEQVSAIEGFVLPAVERFSGEDRFLTWLTASLAREVKWPCQSPIVIAFSTHYYWTYLGYNIVAVPAGEARTLLGLPDLCHELAHALYVQAALRLIGDFLNRLNAYIDNERRRIVAQQQSPAFLLELDQLRARWIDSWLTEFVCDMVATYILGGAFGGQHVRLAAGRPTGAAFYPSLGEDAVHPADEARLRGIATVLQNLGDHAQAELMRTTWRTYMEMSGESEPSNYAVCYPNHLIDALAAEVIRGCRALGIRSFADLTDADQTSIQACMIESWRHFLRSPTTHQNWESTQISRFTLDYEASISPPEATRNAQGTERGIGRMHFIAGTFERDAETAS